MERFYQRIKRHFSQSEISILAADLGIYVQSNADPNAMARELFSGARRNLRLDVLFYEVHNSKPDLELDLGPNLYELIAGTFNETEAVTLTRQLGLDRLGVGLDANGLIGWNNDDFFKNRKAKTIQETAMKQGKYGELLTEMKNIRPSLNLFVFEQSVLNQLDGRGIRDSTRAAEHSRIDVNKLEPQIIQYVQIVLGDFVYGDKYEDIDISDVSDAAIAIGGSASHGASSNAPSGNAESNNKGGSDNKEVLLELIERLINELDSVKGTMRERDAREAAEDLEDVRKELAVDEPDSNWIGRKLNNVAQIVDTPTTNQLTSNVKIAILVLQSLFGEKG